jgi:hypothetical protein
MDERSVKIFYQQRPFGPKTGITDIIFFHHVEVAQTF